MKRLTRESALKWIKRETLTLHEAVCLALDMEPEGKRPEKPSVGYLQAEKFIREEVPLIQVPVGHGHE